MWHHSRYLQILRLLHAGPLVVGNLGVEPSLSCIPSKQITVFLAPDDTVSSYPEMIRSQDSRGYRFPVRLKIRDSSCWALTTRPTVPALPH